MSIPSLSVLFATAALALALPLSPAGAEPDKPATAPRVKQAEANGVINSAVPGRVNITHEAIPILGWPPMQMDFELANGIDTTPLRSGIKVRFTVREVGPAQYRIVAITPQDK